MSKDPGYSDSKTDVLGSKVRFLEDRNQTLVAKIEALNQVNDGLHLLLKEYEAKNKILKEALQFYAREKNWLDEGFINYDGTIDPSDMEKIHNHNGEYDCGGKLARQVLKEIENEEK
jgi:hypothetical protein